MEPDPQRREANLVIRPDVNTFFDKPIAILIGPGSISAGELEARRLSFHPNARIFGLPAPGGNTSSDFISIGDNKLMEGPVAAGAHRVVWDGKDFSGKGLGSGLYFWKVMAGEKTETEAEAVMLVR